MEKCGFVDTGEEILCPNLEVGSDENDWYYRCSKSSFSLLTLLRDTGMAS